jgi:chromosome segregation ATPase
MMDNIPGFTPELLAQLEQDLKKLQAEQDRKTAEEAARLDLLGKPRAPEVTGYSKELADVQEKRRQAHIRAHEEWAAGYQAQLDRNAPRINRIHADLRVLNEREAKERAELDRRLAAIAEERGKLRAKLADLERVPEKPPVVTGFEEPAVDLGIVDGRRLILPLAHVEMMRAKKRVPRHLANKVVEALRNV